MPSPGTLHSLLADLDGSLRGWSWCLIGAQAALLYGSRRATVDVDVSIDADAAQRASLLRRLAAHGIEPRMEDALGFAAETRVLLLLHAATGIPIDLVFAGSELEIEFLARARTFRVGELEIRALSAEDLVASKLLAGRPRDLDDVRDVVRRAPALDVDRIRHLLRLFEQALDRADLLPELDRILTAAGRRP